MEKLYASRKLAQGYPDLENLALDTFVAIKMGDNQKAMAYANVDKLLIQLDRLVDLSELEHVLILGCGPRPFTVEALIHKNYEVVGVEPGPLFVRLAEEYLGTSDRILEGSAEEIPLPNRSQNLVVCESVLEHVDSPTKSLDEIFRVLRPGGIAYIGTTNRYRISLKGDNGEYNIRYFNWLPDIVKESFVFHHLHYDPSLANYTSRPAVHWYSYSDLCNLGRQAGFHQFYSILDLLEPDDLESRARKFVLNRKFLLNKLKYNPWLRAMALTQTGSILMRKRK
jgi:ubiquinone/menaquinone biosynthesis C-methylase UbiE